MASSSGAGVSAGQPRLRIWYDALGRRILSETYDASGDPVTTTRHIYDGLAAIVELEDEGGAPVTWNLAREFIWSGGAGVSAGQSGGAGVSAGQWFPEPLVLIDHTGAGDVPAGQAEHLYFVHDALGSVVGLTNDPAALAALDPNYPGGGGSAGVGGTTGILPALVERYDYDPYGATYIACRDPNTYDDAGETRDSDLLTDPPAWQPCESSRFGNPFLWTAQRYDPGVRLYHFLFRTYSPTLGRWMQRDPVKYVDGLNLYQYCNSAPVTLHDPLGLIPPIGQGGEDWIWWDGPEARRHREIMDRTRDELPTDLMLLFLFITGGNESWLDDEELVAVLSECSRDAGLCAIAGVFLSGRLVYVGIVSGGGRTLVLWDPVMKVWVYFYVERLPIPLSWAYNRVWWWPWWTPYPEWLRYKAQTVCQSANCWVSGLVQWLRSLLGPPQVWYSHLREPQHAPRRVAEGPGSPMWTLAECAGHTVHYGLERSDE